MLHHGAQLIRALKWKLYTSELSESCSGFTFRVQGLQLQATECPEKHHGAIHRAEYPNQPVRLATGEWQPKAPFGVSADERHAGAAADVQN